MKLITVEAWPTDSPVDYRHDLEAGNVIFFPNTPIELPAQSLEFLRNLEFSGGALHKNIAYRPASDRITGINADSDDSRRLLGIMRDFSASVVRFLREFVPQYASAWKLDYASFRPLEENGRDLPTNKRNDLIHTDAFPSRPTGGDLILRVFTNIHPSKTRNWITTDPFGETASRYAVEAGLNEIVKNAKSAGGRLKHGLTSALRTVGIPVVPRSPYDRFMLEFHDYLKRNRDFQENCPKYRFEFPPGSLWLTFTDVLPHSVHSGQHALEQTFIISRLSLFDRANAPVRILEDLCGRPLLTNT